MSHYAARGLCLHNIVDEESTEHKNAQGVSDGTDVSNDSCEEFLPKADVIKALENCKTEADAIESDLYDPGSWLSKDILESFDLDSGNFQNSWELGLQFLIDLVKLGGPAVALLIAFRLLVGPLLAAGSSPVSLVLATAAGLFLVLCGIVAVIRVLR